MYNCINTLDRYEQCLVQIITNYIKHSYELNSSFRLVFSRKVKQQQSILKILYCYVIVILYFYRRNTIFDVIF
jgi:hypothetical protein